MKQLLMSCALLFSATPLMSTVSTVNSNLIISNAQDKINPITVDINWESENLYVQTYGSRVPKNQTETYLYTTNYYVEKFIFDYDWAEIELSFYGNDYYENRDELYYETRRIQIGKLKLKDEVTLWIKRKYSYWRGNEVWYGAFITVTKNMFGLCFYFKVYVDVDGSSRNVWYAQASASLSIHCITFIPR